MNELNNMRLSKIHLLWIKSIAIGVLIYLAAAGYILVSQGIFNIYFANKVFGWTAFFLVNLSMGLTSVGYLISRWRFVLGYRKYIGLVGFWSFVVHGLISLVLLQDEFPSPSYYLSSQQIWSTLASITAAGVMVVMIIASRDFMIKKLGSVNWRRILRLGYLVMVLVIIHFLAKNPVEPLKKLGLIFAAVIFLARVFLEIVIRIKYKNQPTGQNSKKIL